MLIESVNNNKVKLWRSLSNKKYRDKEELFIVEGEHLILEALNSNRLKEIIILDGYDYDYNVEKYYVSESVMKSISNFVSAPKVIGVCTINSSHNISGKRVIILDNVQDPGNLGTIIRSAKAFGIDTIVLGTNCCELYNPKVISATQGMIFNSNIINMNTYDAINKIKNMNIKIFGTDVKEGKNIKEIKNIDSYAFIVGNEGSGLSDDILKLCDEKINIKTNKDVDSLNVAVASSIIMYQLEE